METITDHRSRVYELIRDHPSETDSSAVEWRRSQRSRRRLPLGCGVSLAAALLIVAALGSLGAARHEVALVIGAFLFLGYSIYVVVGAVNNSPVLVVSDRLAHARCGGCGYALNGRPKEADGCRVCPECGGAWRILPQPRDRAPSARNGRSVG